TIAGTVMLHQFNINGQGGDEPGYPIAAANGGAIFSAYDSTTGREPWVSNGTPEGTHLLKDIYPGVNSSHSATFSGAMMNGVTLFMASSNTVHTGLWATDGSSDGTQLIADLLPGSTTLAGRFAVPLSAGRVLYFAFTPSAGGSTTTIYRSDGTSAGTQVVRSGLSLASMAVFGGSLYVSTGAKALSGLDANTVYTCDGSAGATFTAVQSFSASPTRMTGGSDGIYFVGTTAAQGAEPWFTNGLSDGSNTH